MARNGAHNAADRDDGLKATREEQAVLTKSKLKGLFSQVDVDKSGSISRQELDVLMRKLNPTWDDKALNLIFDNVDVNRDGIIDIDEFVDFVFALEEGQTAVKSSLQRSVKREYSSEAAFVRQQGLGARIEAYVRQHSAVVASSAESPASSSGGRKAAKNADGSYHMELPCTGESARGLMQHYIDTAAAVPLNARTVEDILLQFRHAYKELFPKAIAAVEAPQGVGSRLVVVGDTHGQLSDVLCIFHKFGTPSQNNVYIFNGDIADRGPHSVEIFLLVMSFALAQPGCVVINRGNHENEDMNMMTADEGGGFYDQVVNMYGEDIYLMFSEAFKVLSLGVVVHDKYFVVHGGLPRTRGILLSEINEIDHHEFTAPATDSSVKSELHFTDMIWSDPIATPGRYRSPRGIGILFGPDITEAFLDANRLSCVIRSHQMPQEEPRGWEALHDGKCITLFSASNYCGDAGNFGAVLVFEDGVDHYVAHEHYAPPLAQLAKLGDAALWGYSDEDGLAAGAGAPLDIEGLRQEKELETMAWAVVEHKPELWEHFVHKGSPDVVTACAFAKACSKIMGECYPWAKAVASWSLANKDGSLSIKASLQRFGVMLRGGTHSDFKTKAIMQVYESILCADMSLQQTFDRFDSDKDGTVDMRELKEILTSNHLGLTEKQLSGFVASFFAGVPGGRIQVADFLSRFTVVYRQAGDLSGASGAALPPAVAEALGVIGSLLIQNPAVKHKSGADKMKAAFEHLDVSKDGMLQREELVQGLVALPGFDLARVGGSALTQEDIMECMKAVDSSHNGTINYLEFLAAFSVEDRDGDLTDMLADQITTVLFRHRAALRSACRKLDNRSSGFLSKDDFRFVLEILKIQLGDCYTLAQVDLLVESVTDERRGTVAWEDFLNSFELRKIA